MSFFFGEDFTCACSALDDSTNCLAVDAARRANAKIEPEIAKRDAEIERLRAELVAVRRTCADLLEDKHRQIMDANAERVRREADNGRLRGVLEFYAGGNHIGERTDSVFDRGERAQAALKGDG